MWNNDYEGYGNDTTGAGFLNTTIGGTPASKRVGRLNSITPVTIADVLQSEQKDDSFVTKSGLPIVQVTIVGIIRSVQSTTSRVEYKLEDRTGGLIGVRKFLDMEATGTNLNEIFHEGEYVRVIGDVRKTQDERSIAAFKIEKITDANDVVSHIMQVAYACLHYMNCLKADGNGDRADNFFVSSNAPSLFSNSGIKKTGLDMGSTRNQIIAACRAEQSEKGISFTDLQKAMRNVSAKQLRDNLDFLCSEGHLYSTIDEDHFKVTEF